MKGIKQNDTATCDCDEMLQLAASCQADTLHVIDLPYRLYESVRFKVVRQVLVYGKAYPGQAS